MADIRINALATTATTPASDDYLALDGAAQGTRKILATNIANNVTDVILGASGPSVKSTLSARAPRQGLVFDNTLKASITNGAILGTSDFTVAAWINRPASDLSVPLWGPSNSIGFAIRATQITVEKIGASLEAAWDYTVASSKFVSVIVKRSGTTYTCFVDGISIGDKTVGSVTNFSAAYSDVGFTNFTNGTIVGPYIYNRALSASEVVALYEAGAPAGADYGPSGFPAGTAVSTSLSVGTWTGSVAGSTFTISTASTGFISGVVVAYGSLPKAKFRVNYDLTINSGPGPVFTDGAAFSSAALVAGTGKTVELTNPNAGNNLLVGNGYAAGNYVLKINSVTIIGLLLAPDAAQAGGGLVWYDTSGNAANITLPASGVSWNVPTSGNVTSGGALTLRAGGTNQNVNLAPVGLGIVSIIGGTGTQTAAINKSGGANFYFSVVSSADESLRFQNSAGSNLVEFNKGGNLLLGTTIDGGQKLQVSGTSNFSNPGSSTIANFTNSANADFQIVLTASTSAKIGPSTPTSLILQTNGTTALTLDSSQNATFAGRAAINGSYATVATGNYTLSLGNFSAGTRANAGLRTDSIGDLDISAGSGGQLSLNFDTSVPVACFGNFSIATGKILKLGNAYTAGAVVTTGYVTIQDSTGTTYKIPVGT